ncbi:MAG: phage tail protein, partial [Tenacibaculum sp.]|nr:phage tail protein [Tenacibaculum sp.]
MRVYRNKKTIIDISIDNGTQLKRTLQGIDMVQSSFVLKEFFDFKIGDCINWRGKKYVINSEVSVKRNKTEEYQYNIDFVSNQFLMQDAIYMLNGENDFYLMANAHKFISSVVENLNRVFGGGYSVGNIPETIYKNLSFKNENCFSVIQKIAKEFDLEFYFTNDNKTINLTEKIGTKTDLVFEFKKGLRTIERQKLNDKNIITRLYAFGGERNVPKEHGKRLSIPAIEKNTDRYGVIEGAVTFDEIYPHREGVISGVSNDILVFRDTSLDFDINKQLLGKGKTAKITFNTGYLAGYEFEIESFNNSKKEFKIISYEDSNKKIFPDKTLKIRKGDKYVLHDIKMPDTYIQEAKNKLLEKAQQFLNENSIPRVLYNILPDPIELRKTQTQLNVGDEITIKDLDFDIKLKTRIVELNQSLVKPYEFNIKVGEKSSAGRLSDLLANQKDIEKEVSASNREQEIKNNNFTRRFRDVEETTKMLEKAQLNFGKGINPITV